MEFTDNAFDISTRCVETDRKVLSTPLILSFGPLSKFHE